MLAGGARRPTAGAGVGVDTRLVKAGGARTAITVVAGGTRVYELAASGAYREARTARRALGKLELATRASHADRRGDRGARANQLLLCGTRRRTRGANRAAGGSEGAS